MGSTKRPRCCHVGCESVAVYQIVGCGPDAEHDDYIYACAKHVGFLLGWRDGAGAAAYWRVEDINHATPPHVHDGSVLRAMVDAGCGSQTADWMRDVLGLGWLLDAPVDVSVKPKEVVLGMLVCPDCGTTLVKTHYQDADEGHWFVCWTCECEPDEAVIHACD